MAGLEGFQIQLLERLRSAVEPVSAQSLANSLGISERTVRSRLKELNRELKGQGAEICSKTGSGYWLVVTDEEAFEDLFQGREGDGAAFAMNAVRQARAHLLVRYLLCQEGYVKAEELEDILFMGRTAVKQFLARARTILSRSGLELTTKSRQGMKVTGEEGNIRTCLVYEADQIARLRIPLSARERYAELYDFRGEKMGKVKTLVCEALGKSANLSAYSVTYLARLIWVSAIRGGAGRKLSYTLEETTAAEESRFYPVVCRLLEECGQVLEEGFSPEDAVLITGAVRGLQVVLDTGELPGETRCRCRRAAAEVVGHLTRINRFQKLDKDKELVENITRYLSGFFIRTKYHIRTAQFSREALSRCSLMAKKLAIQAFDFLEKRYGVNISEEEIFRLAMLIRPAFGRFPSYTSQLKACCVSNVDKLVGQGMAERIQRNFKRYICQVDVLELYELEATGGGDYDVVFTSYPTERFGYLPETTILISVEPFFDEEDKKRILRTLVATGPGLSLEDYWRPEYLFDGVEANDQEECLRLIEEKLSAVIPLHGELKEDLLRCEINLASRPRENLVILSGMESHAPQVMVAVFVLKRPIQWGSEDSKAQVVIYWDQGMASESWRVLENEFLPHLLELAFYERRVVDGLLKKPDHHFVMQTLQEKNQNITTLAHGR